MCKREKKNRRKGEGGKEGNVSEGKKGKTRREKSAVSVWSSHDEL